MPIISARYNTNTIHLAVNPIHSFYFMCRFKAFMLLRFYLLKYNDTIIVQSGVFVNTKRHKKSHRKGRFCGSFFGENNEVYLSKISWFIVTVAFACGDTKAHCHNAHKTAYQRSCKKFKHKNTSCG